MGKRSFEDELQDKIEDFFKEMGKDPKRAVPILIALPVVAIYFFHDKLLAILPTGMLPLLMNIGIGILKWIALIAAGIFIARIGTTLYHYYYNKKRYTYLRILPNAEDDVDATTLGEMIRRIHNAQRGPIIRSIRGKDWFSLVVHNDKNNQITYYIGGPRDRMNSVRNHFSSLYANAEFFPVESVPMPSIKAVGGRLGIRRKKSTLSLAKYKKDQMPGVLDVMKPNSWIQVAFSGDSERVLKKLIVEEEKAVKKDNGWRDRNAFEREEEKSFKGRFSGSEVSFNVTVSIAAEPATGWNAVRDIADAIIGIMNDVNELKYKRLFGRVRRYPLPFPHKMIWTGSELAKLLHLPELKGSGVAQRVARRITYGTAGTQQMEKDVLSDPKGFTIGTLVHPLLEGRQVKIGRNVLAKHWAITGITGSGKSTVLNTVLKSFIEGAVLEERSPGFSFIDPKKETATIVLNQMLKMELDGHKIDWDKVRWVSFKDSDHPPAMNLLYRMPGVPDNVIVDQVLRIIRENTSNQAHQAERLLKKCIETLMADREVQHTILGVQSLLLKAKFRAEVLGRLENDPKNISILDFWEFEAEDLMKQSTQAIQNRLDIFHGEFMSRIFGQPDFKFPLRKWMDEGYMIFYDFNGMGEEETGIVGGYLAYLYYRTADTRPDRPLMHQLIIDEAQRVKASILPEVIAEMRSKGLGLGIGSQTLEGLPPELRNKLVNVAGSVFVCKQGMDGAKKAAEAFRTIGADGKDKAIFPEAFFTSLPNLRCAIRTEDKGETVTAVVDVPPLDRYLPNGKAALYGDTKQAERETIESNEWTYAKAKELEQVNGAHVDDVDRAIHEYMSKGSTKKPMQPKAKVVAAPAPKETKVVEKPVSILDLMKGETE